MNITTVERDGLKFTFARNGDRYSIRIDDGGDEPLLIDTGLSAEGLITYLEDASLAS